MPKDELCREYFEWMCQLVCRGQYSSNVVYQKLLNRLHNTDFFYILEMDDNRANDGIDLRYRFGYEQTYNEPMIASYLDVTPCSVLEMLIALAMRCEEHIMSDPDIGDRTGQWFWNMVENLGLTDMDDTKFDEEYVDQTVSRFLNRQYKRNGEGGLFTVLNCKYDLRNVEIWYQMCWHLDDIL